MGYLFCYCVHKIKILLMRFFANANFSRSQKQHKARTLCISLSDLWIPSILPSQQQQTSQCHYPIPIFNYIAKVYYNMIISISDLWIPPSHHPIGSKLHSVILPYLFSTALQSYASMNPVRLMTQRISIVLQTQKLELQI